MFGHRNSMTPSVNATLPRLLTLQPTFTAISDVVRDTFSDAFSPKVIEGLSDHLAITFSVDISIKAPCNFRQVNTRKIHRININDFRDDILNSDLIKHPHKTTSLLSHQYFNTLRNILDRNAPVNNKKKV